MKHIKNFSMFEAVDVDAKDDEQIKLVKKKLKKLNNEHNKLVNKLKGLTSPGAYATKTKSDIRAIENEINNLKKKYNI